MFDFKVNTKGSGAALLLLVVIAIALAALTFGLCYVAYGIVNTPDAWQAPLALLTTFVVATNGN